MTKSFDELAQENIQSAKTEIITAISETMDLYRLLSSPKRRSRRQEN